MADYYGEHNDSDSNNVGEKTDAVERLNDDDHPHHSSNSNRRSRSGPKGRKTSSHHKRHSGSDDRRRTTRTSESRGKNSPTKKRSSASRSNSDGQKRNHHQSKDTSSLGIVNLNDAVDDERVSSPRCGERPKSFLENKQEDLKSPLRDSLTRSNRHSSHGVVVIGDTTHPRASPRSPRSTTNDLVITSWHSRSTASSNSCWSDDSDYISKRTSSRRSKTRPGSSSDLAAAGSSNSKPIAANARSTAKVSKQRSQRASKAGMEFVSSPSGNTKGKIDTSIRSTAVEVLYGDDVKARKRSSDGDTTTNKRANRAGAEPVSPSRQSRSSRTATEVLYGDAQAKAKAKSSLLKDSSNQSKTTSHGINTSHSTKRATVTDTLYGDDDAKKRARARRSTSSNHHPRVERVVVETESDDSSRSSSFPSVASRSQPVLDGSLVTGIMVEASSSSSYHHSLQGQANNNNAVSNSSLREQTNDIDGAHLPVLEGRHTQRKSSNKNKRKKQWQTTYFRYFVFAAILIILLGGGSITFIALSRGSDDHLPNTQAGGNNLQEDPATPPSASSNEMPTAPPTNKPVLDPPSPEDCEAIRNNQTIVPGQQADSTAQKNFNMNVQINVKGNTTMTDEMVQDLMNAIQEFFLTSIAGCNNNTDDGGQRTLWGTRGGSTRKLQVAIDDESSRFAVLFAYVKGQVQENTTCVGTSSPESSCFVVLVAFTLYLDGDITSSAIESIIYEEFESGNNFVSTLNLGDSFLSATTTNITDVTPSFDAPSSESSTGAPSGSPSSNMAKPPADASPTVVPEPTPSVVAPTVGPVAGPTPISNTLPSVMPTDAPSTSPSASPSTSRPSASPSLAPSSSPSSSPTLMPVVEPSPPPTVAPTLSPSSLPSIKQAEPSATPTVQGSETPSTIPSIVNSSSPSMSSSAPSPVPSRGQSSYPISSVPLSPVPSKSPDLNSSSEPTDTRCYCMNAGFCDATVSTDTFLIGCGACAGSQSCVYLSSSGWPGEMPIIGIDACQEDHSCENTTVAAIRYNSCVGEYSCFNRIVSTQIHGCHGNYACAASSSNTDGKLRIGPSACHGQYACYSYIVRAKQSSCHGDWACAGRSKIYANGGACIGHNACSGAVFTPPIGARSERWDDPTTNILVRDEAQTEPSYFGRDSCTCENCCVCMVRVVSGRCTSLGECCDEEDPTQQVAPDNTEAEMKEDLGVTDDLLSVFPVCSSDEETGEMICT